jgi:hypothetical protein
MKHGQLNQQNGTKSSPLKNAMTQCKSLLTTQPKTSTSSPSSATTMTREMMSLVGSFNKYQVDRFWTSFDHDLYNRICEIKMQEI